MTEIVCRFGGSTMLFILLLLTHPRSHPAYALTLISPKAIRPLRSCFKNCSVCVCFVVVVSSRARVSRSPNSIDTIRFLYAMFAVFCSFRSSCGTRELLSFCMWRLDEENAFRHIMYSLSLSLPHMYLYTHLEIVHIFFNPSKIAAVYENIWRVNGTTQILLCAVYTIQMYMFTQKRRRMKKVKKNTVDIQEKAKRKERPTVRWNQQQNKTFGRLTACALRSMYERFCDVHLNALLHIMVCFFYAVFLMPFLLALHSFVLRLLYNCPAVVYMQTIHRYIS